MLVPSQLWGEAKLSLLKTVALYELLLAHARGETDLTEDQLANVVLGLTDEARGVLRRMEAEDAPGGQEA